MLNQIDAQAQPIVKVGSETNEFRATPWQQSYDDVVTLEGYFNAKTGTVLA